MDPFSIAGITLEALGLGKDTVVWIKKVVAKKIIVTPREIPTITKHWDSNSSVIIQNTTDKPLFAVQIVCWFDEGQEIEFYPHHMQKMKTLGSSNVSMDTAIFTISGNMENGRPLYLLELGRLMPKESLEIDLQIKGKGCVRFLPMKFDENRPRPVVSDENIVGMQFTAPDFKMSLNGIGLWMKTD